MLRKKIKWILLGVLIFIVLYLVIGMLAPFWHMQTLKGKDAQTDPSIYYGSEEKGERARIVETSTEALEQRIRMIEEAESRLVLSTFDMRPGKSTDDLAAAMLAAAERGVQVQILVDGVSGLIRMEGTPLFYALSSHPNIEIRIYNMPNPLKPWTFHGRMHDKYLISDERTLLLGGRNTFDYFIGDYTKKNRSYDREVLVYHPEDSREENSAIDQTYAYFEKVWNLEVTRPFHEKKSLENKPKVKAERERMQKHYKEMREKHPDWFASEKTWEEQTVPIRKATLVSGETGIYGKKPYVWRELKGLMEAAEERVILHTPYAVLNRDMEEGMRRIAENVPEFTMVLNSVENGDNIVASGDYLRHKQDIIDTGVRIFEFDGGDSTHGKSILVDDRISAVGSYNLDLRSTYMDTELMLVIDSEPLNRELEKYMDYFQRNSRRVIDRDTYDIPVSLQIQKAPARKNSYGKSWVSCLLRCVT